MLRVPFLWRNKSYTETFRIPTKNNRNEPSIQVVTWLFIPIPLPYMDNRLIRWLQTLMLLRQSGFGSVSPSFILKRLKETLWPLRNGFLFPSLLLGPLFFDYVDDILFFITYSFNYIKFTSVYVFKLGFPLYGGFIFIL